MKTITESNSIPPFLKKGKEEIEVYLKDFIKIEFTKLKKSYPYFSPLLPVIENYILRKGKRIRPILTILSYKGYSSEDDKILPAAIGTELLHSAFLIQDDLYDEMPGLVATRGGGKVLQDRFLTEFEKDNPGDSNWNPKKFADHACIAIVNILLSSGAKCLTDSKFPEKLILSALELYWDTVKIGEIGQCMDILSKKRSISNITDEEVESIELLRSAAYSTRFPILLGATLAGADNAELSKLSSISYKIGLAYQIHDDIIGIFADSSESGKSQSEWAEGKRTLLLTGTIKRLSSDDKTDFFNLLRKGVQSEKEIKLVRRYMKESGAFNEVLERGKSSVRAAQKEIKKLKATELLKKQLNDFADFVISRKY